MHRHRAALCLLFVPALAACPPEELPDGGSDLPIVDAGPSYDVDVEPRCTEGSRFEPGAPAFADATAAWGLDGIAVEGTRLNVADVDGDGRADLFVRRGGSRSDDLGPDGSRHSWLLRNTGAAFEDITEQSGVLAARGALGALGRPHEVAAFADVDNDGDLDVYTGLATADPAVALGETSELLLGDGAGGFTLAAESSALRRANAIDAPAGASFVDVDLDGFVDLWVPQHNYEGAGGTVFAQDRAFRGIGDGTFEERTLEWGLSTAEWSSIASLNEGRAHTRAWGAAACDLNDDGLPDLLAPSYGRSPNHLWQASRDVGEVVYLNWSVGSGYAYDDDQTWSDNQFARCFCQANPSAADCAGVPPPTIGCSPNWSHDFDREPFRLGGNSGASVCADVDNDGDLDVLTTEIRHWWAGSGADGSELLLNNGGSDVTFERPGDEALGLAIAHSSASWDEGHMTAAVFDFDNDGWPDIYIGGSDYGGNRGLLYQQREPLSFVEVDPVDGIDHHRSHGVAVADFDRDGDLDVAVGHSRSRCDAGLPFDCYPTQQVRLFENLVGAGGNWMQLSLEGSGGANRSAIGARVRVTAGDVTQTQEVSGGHGHYGAQHDLVLHFGLGAACDAEVEVRWPDAEQTVTRYLLPAGHRFRLSSGGGASVAP